MSKQVDFILECPPQKNIQAAEIDIIVKSIFGCLLLQK